MHRLKFDGCGFDIVYVGVVGGCGLCVVFKKKKLKPI